MARDVVLRLLRLLTITTLITTVHSANTTSTGPNRLSHGARADLPGQPPPSSGNPVSRLKNNSYSQNLRSQPSQNATEPSLSEEYSWNSSSLDQPSATEFRSLAYSNTYKREYKGSKIKGHGKHHGSKHGRHSRGSKHGTKIINTKNGVKIYLGGNNPVHGQGSSQSSASMDSSPTLALKHRKALENLIDDISSRKLRKKSPNAKLFGPLSYTSATRRSILCEFKKLPPLTYSRNEPPFSNSAIGKYFPINPVIHLLRGNKQFNSCAMVSSAGSLAGSRLGNEIDSHDVVMRLNGGDEDVGSFGRDVGRRTTINMVNNNGIQKMYKERKSYPRKRIVIGWEGCYFDHARRTPDECYSVENNWLGHKSKETVNWNTVPSFMRWRAQNPHNKAFLAVEKWLYQLTDAMQKFSPYRLYGGNVPSTGFIGFATLLHNCKEVHVYHMVPPYSSTKKPYYYYSKPSSDDKLPLDYLDKRLTHQHLMEKTLLMKMNTASNEEAYIRGHIVVPGVSQIHC